MAKVSKKDLLEKIKADIIKDKVCPELATSAKKLVFGDGSADAEVVFIGEAPGQKEDEQGLPFVGAAGQFLNELLDSIDLKRADVYITNIVKYRPPNNRDPYPDEKAAFLPYLHAQLEAIKPKLIIALGRHSLEVLVPGLKISQCHGQPKRVRIMNQEVRSKSGEQDITSLVILPLFHPAAALYNGGMRQTLIDDFKKIPKVLEEISNLAQPPEIAKPAWRPNRQPADNRLPL